VVDRLLCIDKQIEYHKYVIMSDLFDNEDKKSKAELVKIMQELNEMKHSEMDIHCSVKHSLFCNASIKVLSIAYFKCLV
jgi:hypothetical protein